MTADRALDAGAVWEISGFDDGPHWGVAYIEADSAQSAAEVLATLLEGEGTVWEVTPSESWTIAEARRPIRFVLGSGCR